MRILEERILREGTVTVGGILKVDTFINQMVDTKLMEAIGEEIGSRYREKGITKVMTLESSGIPFACEVARRLGIPAVFARKHEYVTLDEGIHQSRIYSYTRRKEMVIRVGRNLLMPEDQILIVDDFMANGSAVIGLVDIIKQAGAAVAGVCILIEKGFQSGREKLQNLGIPMEALVTIERMDEGKIEFRSR